MVHSVGSSPVKSLHLITPAPRGCLCVHRVRVSDSRKTKTHLEEGKTEVPHASPTAPHPQFLPQAHSFRGPAGRWFLPRTPRGRVERDDPTHVPVPAPAAEAAMHLSSRARGSTPAVSPNPRGRPTRHSPSTNPPSPTPATAQHPAAQASPQALASRLHAECGGAGEGGLAAIPRPSSPHNGRSAHSPRAPTHAGLAASRSGSRSAPPPQDPDAAAGAVLRDGEDRPPPAQPPALPPPPRQSPRPQPQPQRRSPGAS